MSLSKTLYPLLNTSSTQEDRKLPQFDLKIVDLDVKHEQKQQITSLVNKWFSNPHNLQNEHLEVETNRKK